MVGTGDARRHALGSRRTKVGKLSDVQAGVLPGQPRHVAEPASGSAARINVFPVLPLESQHVDQGRRLLRTRHFPAHEGVRRSARNPVRGDRPADHRRCLRPAGHLLPVRQGLLRGQGQPGHRDHRAAARQGLELRHRLDLRAGQGHERWRRPRAHQLRQHHQEGARHSLLLRQGRAPVRHRLRSRPAQHRQGRAGGQDLCAHPHRRLHQRRLAAVAQVRLQPGHGPGSADPGQAAGPGALRHFLPRRQPAARYRRVGRRHRQGQGDLRAPA